MRYFCGTSIPAMLMISHKVSLRDIFVIPLSLLCQWYISGSKLVRYFCGTSDTHDTSNTANSCDASKTSAFVTRLSSYFNGAAPQIYIFLWLNGISFRK